MTKLKDTDIPVDFLRAILVLDMSMESNLRWLKRPRDHFPKRPGDARIWNTRRAGKQAGVFFKGYWRVRFTFNGQVRQVLAHRIVVALVKGEWWPEHEVDHEKGVDLGNGTADLREATTAENAQNRKKHRNNTSRYPGVSWLKRQRKWRAWIAVGHRNIDLGLSNTREEAYTTYLAAKAILAPVPRGMTTTPNIHSSIRLRAVKSIVSAARRRKDRAMEWAAWQEAFLTAS